jgi:hypothetical protein
MIETHVKLASPPVDNSHAGIADACRFALALRLYDLPIRILVN